MTEWYHRWHHSHLPIDKIGSCPGLAAHIGVSRVALSRVLHEKAAVTPEMSIRISQAVGQPSPDIWFNLQNDYDFWKAAQGNSDRERITPLHTSAA